MRVMFFLERSMKGEESIFYDLLLFGRSYATLLFLPVSDGSFVSFFIFVPIFNLASDLEVLLFIDGMIIIKIDKNPTINKKREILCQVKRNDFFLVGEGLNK